MKIIIEVDGCKMKIKLLSIISIYLFASHGSAYVSIDVGKAHIRQSQVALQPFILTSQGHSPTLPVLQAGAQLFKILQHNLSALGRFRLIDQQAFLEKPGEKSLKPYPQDNNGFIWKNWQLLNTDYLIVGKYHIINNEGKIVSSKEKKRSWRKNSDQISKQKIQVECFLYHIPLKKKLLHRRYITDIQKLRHLVNYISDDIVQVITGTSGFFLTKIVAVKNMSGIKKELFLMDWDGSNSQQISFHRSVVVSPFWSPDGNSLAYTAFLYHRRRRLRNAALLLYDRNKKTRRIISNRPGANLGFDFFPTGHWILGSLILKGNRNIVQISQKNGSVQPITSFMDGSINVEPTVHPQGRQIAFSSDRGGKVMIYSMNLNRRNIKRLTYQGSYNSTPDYSPDGQQLVFSGRDNGRTDVFIMNTNGSQIRRLTSVRNADGKWANNESPCFSPDGRHIVFASNQSGKYQLYIMNILNYRIKKITNDPYGYKAPKWSPFLNP